MTTRLQKGRRIGRYGYELVAGETEPARWTRADVVFCALVVVMFALSFGGLVTLALAFLTAKQQ